MLLFAALATSLVQPAHAGTEAAPEIQDPAGDHELSPAGEGLAGLGAACDGGAPCFDRVDVLSGWIDEETDSQFNVNIALSNAPLAAAQYMSHYEFHATFGGTEVVSTAGVDTAGPVAGDNVVSVAAEGNTLVLTIAKSVYGAAAGDGELSAVFIVAYATLAANGMVDSEVELANDRAPDADGVTYAFGGGGGGGSCPNCTADDTDGDGLNDTWEIEYFGNTTAQNATGDPDGDGLTNGQEQALGTDPTKADTDGDGANDKDDSAPLDPTKGGRTTSSSRSTTSRSSTSTSGTSTGDRAGGEGGDGEVESLDDAIDRLESDLGYVGMSAGGFLAVLILCILALAVRWSL